MPVRRLIRLLIPLFSCALVAAACGWRGSSSELSSNTVETPTTVSSTTTTTAPTTTTTRPTTTTTLPEPEAETDPDVLAEFVSEHNGEHQLDDEDVTVRNLEVGENKEGIPPEIFAEPDLWRLFQILGLVEPDIDALEVGQHRVDTIRGMCCPVSMWDNDDHPLLRSSVLVHELTHLADEDRDYYDDLDEQDFLVAEREPINLLAVPVEGNASRVQRLYENELIAAGARPDRFLPRWDGPDIPDAMVRVWEFAYFEGQVFMQALVDRRGIEQVSLAFDRPPISSEQVFDVDAYLNDEVPLDVERPDIPAGADLLQPPMTLGAFVLVLLGEESLDPGAARQLATSWAGDSTIVYRAEGQWCANATIVMDDGAAADELLAVFDAVELGAAKNDAQPDTVDLAHCIPAPAG